MRDGCPTPWKISYGSRREAVQAHRQAKQKTSGLKPYHCGGCDGWHLTSMSRNTLRQVRRRQRAA